MPLVFPPAPKAYFKRANESHKTENTNDLGFKMFPLEIQNNMKAVPVEPLFRPKMPTPPMPQKPPIPPHKLAPLAHMLQQPRTQPPVTPPMQMPLQMNPPVTPQMPVQMPAAAPQQLAAEQFRRVNRTLPDGVRFEPLDDKTMQILNAKSPQTAPPKATIPQNQAQAVPPQTQAAFPQVMPSQAQAAPPQTMPPDIVKILKQLAQDERNAFVFYSFFAEKTKEPFELLAKDSKKRLELYISLIATNFNENFTPSETEINTKIEPEKAVKLALSEEKKGLITLGNLLDLTADTSAEKPLTRLLNRKIIGYQLLLSV